jgi:hypothetical protein
MRCLKVYAYRVRRKIGGEGGQFLPGAPAVGYRLMRPATLARPRRVAIVPVTLVLAEAGGDSRC